MISNMEADVMVVGASEAPINPLIVAGFNQYMPASHADIIGSERWLKLPGRGLSSHIHDLLIKHERGLFSGRVRLF